MIKAGLCYRFAYPEAFVTLPEYTARRGQIVLCVRKCTAEEADGPELECEQMYVVLAADGWKGNAWESELEPIRHLTKRERKDWPDLGNFPITEE
jgi:hypothetical protein